MTNMPVLRRPDISAWRGTLAPRRLLKFASVGLAATVLYAFCASLFTSAGSTYLPPATASVAAYSVAAIFSYLGHKFFTFMSAGSHQFEAPRFAVLTGFGLAIAYLLPLLLVGQFGLPVAIPILLTCVLIPVVNFVVLERWIFSGRSAAGLDGDPERVPVLGKSDT
ncbi:MAG: GtrA family protein [Mesorhizobium sp.]|nr:MAG: GtrA family protein [Mesorhizobium sp.]TIT05532.1 MAG: GtrA family protein [Mesorhizobium sp.]TIX60692.1 MAG: GtrA family protein [Mesorhizobium sp.]